MKPSILHLKNTLKSLTGFTYIEMLVVVTLVGLCFVPLLQMFASSMDEVMQYSELGTATQIGHSKIERVKNLRMNEDQIEKMGTVWIPSAKEPPIKLNHKEWRVKREAIKGTDPLEIHISVFRDQDLLHPLIELVTLIEDV